MTEVSEFERFNFPVLFKDEKGNSRFEVTRRPFYPDDPSYRLRITLPAGKYELPDSLKHSVDIRRPEVATNQVITGVITRAVEGDVVTEPDGYVESIRNGMAALNIFPEVTVIPLKS